MLKKTYEKINALFEESNGYLSTRKLLDNKITTIQIRTMLEEGKIEKISHGNYWNRMSGQPKPENYKMIEACMTNPRAVICSLSACYYHGLLKDCGCQIDVRLHLLQQLRLKQQLLQPAPVHCVPLNYRDKVFVKQTAHISQPFAELRIRRSVSGAKPSRLCTVIYGGKRLVH